MECLTSVGIAARGVAKSEELVVHEGREYGRQARQNAKDQCGHQSDLGQGDGQQYLTLVLSYKVGES